MFELAQGYARRGHDRLRRAAGARVRARGGRLHRDPPPARGRRRLLRPGRAGGQRRRARRSRCGLDRGGAVRGGQPTIGDRRGGGVPAADARPDRRGARVRRRAAPRLRTPSAARLLDRRAERRDRLAAGELPDFLPDTRELRDGGLAASRRRRPTCATAASRSPARSTARWSINALNSGARVFMADFEDANSPTWANCVEGQANLIDAVERTISLETPEKTYRLNDETATLVVRPRGWHLRRAAPRGRRRARLGEPVRLRALGLPPRAAAARRAARARTSTCRSSRATSRRGSGRRSSGTRRTSSACRAARSARRC